MRGSLRAGLTGLLAALFVCGCAHRGHSPEHGGDARGGIEVGLAAASRGTIEVDVRAVGALAEVNAALGHLQVAPPMYHRLSADECQCLAVSASMLGNLFASESCVVQATSGVCGRGSEDGDSVQIDVLCTAAQEARNRSAAEALTTFYLLAESEGRLDLIDGGIQALDGVIADIARMRAQGMQIPLDETQFQRERIALVDQRVQLDAGIERLNARLWGLVGIERPSRTARIWPATDLTVDVQPIDVEAAVQDAMALRPELQMLRRLRSSLNLRSLAGARQALSKVDALLGSEPAGRCVFSPLGLRTALGKLQTARRELEQRRRQLAMYQRQREQQVADQVRQAVADAETKLRQIALSKATAEQWDARVVGLEGRATTGGATFAEVASARLSRQRAQADLIGHVAEWKIALVRLKEAQGLLVAECGR